MYRSPSAAGGVWGRIKSAPLDDVGGLKGKIKRSLSEIGEFRREKQVPCVLIGSTAAMGPQSLKSRVRTEFVFVESEEKPAEVYVAGDWNTWTPIRMTREGDGLWTVITQVPLGYREFCFILDGTWTISSRHPCTADNSSNWRMVHGPPAKVNCGRWSTGALDVTSVFSKDVGGTLEVGLGSTDYSKDIAQKLGWPGSSSKGAIPLLYFCGILVVYLTLYFTARNRGDTM